MKNEIILFDNQDIKLEVNMKDETVWLNREQMAKLSPNGNKKMVYIPNGVVINKGEKKCDLLSKWDLEPSSYILAVGRITPEKGFDLLISAHKEMNLNKKLVIVGAVEAEKDYYASIKAINNPNVKFLGYQSGEDLKQIYQNASLFVLSSYNEGFPLVLLEAMSYNIPILVSDIPATHLIELEQDDYFKCGDKEDLKDKLLKKIESMPKSEYNYSLSDYRWDSVAKSTLNVYKSLLNK